MLIERKRKSAALTDITPLIDVVFLLLIFFMLTTTFAKETALNIKLPEATSHVPPLKNQALEVSVDENGHYYLNEKRLVDDSPKTLEHALATHAKKALPLKIVGDAKAPHQAIVTALQVAGSLGISQIQIAAMTPSQVK